jgi:SPP1 gp7 family putative phage head morphogenesis protein
MRTLPGQTLRDRDAADMEAQLARAFYDLVFRPVIEALETASSKAQGAILNDKFDALRSALRAGRIQLTGGEFSGELSAAISRALRLLGAKIDQRKKTYSMPVGDLPSWVQAEATNYRRKAQTAHEEALRGLSEAQKGLEAAVKAMPLSAGETVKRVDRSWRETAKDVEVMPELTPEAMAGLAAGYTESIRPYIKKFAESSILELRELVEGNAEEGYRFDRLINRIRQRYGVTKTKAKFLARQETGLFMAQYRKQRFTEAGIRRYRWSTAKDVRVRDAHADLDGREFSYDDPPIVDTATGRRANPGEDFNCRCVDLPLVEAAA